MELSGVLKNKITKELLEQGEIIAQYNELRSLLGNSAEIPPLFPLYIYLTYHRHTPSFAQYIFSETSPSEAKRIKDRCEELYNKHIKKVD